MILLNAVTANDVSAWRNIESGVYWFSTRMSAAGGTVTFEHRHTKTEMAGPIKDASGAVSHADSDMTLVFMAKGQIRCTVTGNTGQTVTVRVEPVVIPGA